MNAAATVVCSHCLVHGARPSLAGAPAGLPGGGALRLLEAGRDLWLVIGDVPADRYCGREIERRLQDVDWVGRCAVAHEAVVTHFMAAGTVLPMKLFTLFNSDASALARIDEQRATIEATIARVAGCREYGLQVVLQRDALDAAARAHAERGAAGAAGPGAAFLRKKQAQRDAVPAVLAQARGRAGSALEALAAVVTDVHRRPVPPLESGSTMVVDAALLVEDARAEAFRSEVERVAAEIGGDGLAVKLTGPWPAYHFLGAAS